MFTMAQESKREDWTVMEPNEKTVMEQNLEETLSSQNLMILRNFCTSSTYRFLLQKIRVLLLVSDFLQEGV